MPTDAASVGAASAAADLLAGASAPRREDGPGWSADGPGCSAVSSLGDGNTCICECILKYYDVFGVAFENTCINAVFLMYCKRIPIVRRIHVFQSCILLYPICIPEYMRIHENTSAIHMTYSALIEYVRIRCILRILLEYLTIFERKYTRF